MGRCKNKGNFDAIVKVNISPHIYTLSERRLPIPLKITIRFWFSCTKVF